MLGSQTLEVAIGIIFVYLLVSIICTAVREGIEGWLKTRSVYLEHGIRELLHDKDAADLVKSFYHHPLVYSLYSGVYTPGTATRSMMTRGKNLPSYIPSKNFALALMDIAARGPQTDAASSDTSAPIVSLDAIRANIANLHNPAVQRVLLTAIDAAQGDINKAQANLEAWYDSGMDRVSGWYKRSTQLILFVIGLLVAVGLNVNTVTIAQYLYRNDAARAAIVARSEAAVTNTAFAKSNYDDTKKELDTLKLPIGWTGWTSANPNVDGWWNTVFALIVGWLFTAFAATLGAPFWFDILNKVMVIRSTVKPHEKSPEESSEDRQKPAVQPAVAAQPAAAAVAPAVAPAPPTPPPFNARAQDAESELDGCDAIAASDVVTADADLPAAAGGVQ